MPTQETQPPTALLASTAPASPSALISPDDLRSLAEVYAFIHRTGRSLLIILEEDRVTVSNGSAQGAPCYGWSWDRDDDVEGSGPTLTNAWDALVPLIAQAPDQHPS
jgi:hypothetical protein